MKTTVLKARSNGKTLAVKAIQAEFEVLFEKRHQELRKQFNDEWEKKRLYGIDPEPKTNKPMKLSALNARWRDVRLTIPFLLQVWMFASPLAYPASMVPDRWAHYYSLNPMVGIVEGFRWCMTGQGALDVVSLAIATVSASVVFITGMIYFQSVDSTIADVV